MKPTFGGHETFPCRYFWLKKGFDFQKKGESFSSDFALVELGVGKNMVNSIRYWLKSLGFNSEDDKHVLHSIFNDENEGGFDPFLEDVNTLWLLHFLLIKREEASIYSYFFNEFNSRTEFTFENFEYFLKLRCQDLELQVSDNTIESDVKVFRSMYLRPKKPSRSLEDDYSGLFQELGLFFNLKGEQFLVNTNAAKEISPYLLLYVIYEVYPNHKSISFNELLNNRNSLGKIFCFNQSSLYTAIEQIVNKFDFLTFREDAGIRELQFKAEGFKDKISILSAYYNAK